MTVAENFRARYWHYVEDYKSYLRRRGFGDHLNDRPFARRAFLECWAQPGFHRFWRVYNPGIAYFCFRLYRVVGGNRRRTSATLVSFLTCGVVHNLFVFAFLGWSYTLPVAFCFFGSLSLLSFRLSPILQQHRWPRVINTAVNVALVVGGMDVGFRVDALLQLRL